MPALMKKRSLPPAPPLLPWQAALRHVRSYYPKNNVVAQAMLSADLMVFLMTEQKFWTTVKPYMNVTSGGPEINSCLYATSPAMCSLWRGTTRSAGNFGLFLTTCSSPTAYSHLHTEIVCSIYFIKNLLIIGLSDVDYLNKSMYYGM